MNIVMFGPPGAGKGSVSAFLVGEFSYPHIAAGDIIREEARKPQNKVRAYMEKGELVPDTVIMQLVGSRLRQPDCREGFILDGFPRTIVQAEFLERQRIPVDIVINLEVDEDAIVDRLSGRRMDPKTGQIYNLNTMELPEGVDREKLVQRPDDKPEVIRKRIEVYKKQTSPVIEYYRERNVLLNIDGNPELGQVVGSVREALQKVRE
ncbi:TPA: nucleoside monophosphate kinase [Candidatus Woesearchaeota archaeon]|nr:nucleoside monophosphate kinase [Candidatus Woesearchaeota archaeon]HII64218.1 nucleoside monophosphate kinase [Candidatus Woesearchaeota archaeon]